MTGSDHWLLAQLNIHAPGFWIVLSVGVTLALSLFWGVLPTGGKEFVLLLRCFVLPYVGLLLGGLSPRFMGLNGLDWLVSLSLGIGLILIILLALACARITVAFATPLNDSAPHLPNTQRQLHTELFDRTQPALLSTVIYQVYRSGVEEFYWVFLRGTLWELFLTAPLVFTLPAYWAVWGAGLLALPDLLLTERTLLHRLLKVVVLITTSILFLYTRNFWLCWMLHIAGWAILASGYGTHSPTATLVQPGGSKSVISQSPSKS